MKRIIAAGLIGFAVVSGIVVGTSANAAPKAKPPVTTSTSTETPDPTLTRTVKPEYTIPPCLVDGEPEAC